MQKFSLAFSPCPNDCFIFDALIHKRIDTNGFEFDVHLEDVETLNRWAIEGKCDITKLSYAAFTFCSDNYQWLNAGSALGNKCGPLLISKDKYDWKEIDDLSIAIPGKMTTANFLLSIAKPNAKNKTEVIFSEIEDAVLQNKFDAGLIIHENRFTYEQKGLQKIRDLGDWWEETYNAPIPLGGIVIRRSTDEKTKKIINNLIRESVEFAFAHPEESMPYVRQHAQSMDEKVMKQHIDLYVNKYSIDLGTEGKKAIETMYEVAEANHLIEKIKYSLFVE
jgi:1,4-dihydroxy-6-naphthoate synthase